MLTGSNFRGAVEAVAIARHMPSRYHLFTPLSRMSGKVLRGKTEGYTTRAAFASTSAEINAAPPADFISLSGCGFLIPYHVGVLRTLERRGQIDQSTLLAGASGGALVSAAYASGIHCDDIMQIFMDVYRWTRTHGVWTKVGKQLKHVCKEALPPDAHERASGRLLISVHRTSPFQLQPVMIDSFTSQEDLVQACYCSSFIPLFLEPRLSCEWRGAQWVDGGLLDMLPAVPSHLVAKSGKPPRVIKSLPFELVARLRSDTQDIITLHAEHRSKFPLRKLINWAVNPPADESVFFDLQKAGEDTAEAWLMGENK